MGPQRPVQNSETKEVEFCLKGNSAAWSSSLKREVLWPGWGKEIILFPEVQLIPLDISEGYHYGCYFEERPLISGRVHCHGASSIKRNRNLGMSQGCALGFKPTWPQLCQSTYLSKLGSVRLRTMIWCKLLLDYGCCGWASKAIIFIA